MDSSSRHHPSTTQAMHASASGTYPFRGIYYFLSHRFLWPLLASRLLPVFVLSLAIYAILFSFTYLPQVLFLAIFHGPLAWLNGAFLVLGEGAVVIQCLFEAFMCDETLVDVFDAVLVEEGCENLVSPFREIDDESANSLQRLGRPSSSAVYSPFSFRLILEFILFLPLNLIPFVGTLIFLVLTGRRAGPFHHWRYFQLLRYDRKQRRETIKSRRVRYTLFGTTALILQLLPGISLFFLLTTAAGSAVWASRLERQRLAMLRQVQHDPPPYQGSD